MTMKQRPVPRVSEGTRGGTWSTHVNVRELDAYVTVTLVLVQRARTSKRWVAHQSEPRLMRSILETAQATP